VSAKILKNASSLVLVQIINPLLGMAFVVALARINGAAGLGEYTFALSMVAIFEGIAGLGLRGYIIREIGKCQAKWHALFRSTMALGLASALLAQIAMLVIAKMMGYEDGILQGLFIVSFSLLPTVVMYVLMSILYAFDRMAVSGFIQIMETLVRVILGMGIIFLGLGMSWLLAGFVISRAIAALMTWRAQIKYVGMPRRVWDKEVFRALLKVAPTFAGMAVLAAVYWRLNILMLSCMAGTEAVGQFSAGYRLMDLIAFVGGGVLTAVYPTLSRMFHHARKNFQLLIDKGVQYAIMAYLPVAIAVHELGAKILIFFYGPEFTPAVAGFRILIWMTLPFTLAKLFANGLVIAGYPNLDLRVNIYRLIWNVVLNYFLIGWMGMVGACLATLISIIASVFLQIYYLRAVVRPTLQLSHVLKPCMAAISMLFVLKLTGEWHLIPQFLIAVAVYLGTLLILKPFDREDRRMLDSLGRQPAGETI
jgi:O-antigen/teichoic acid export membrane protein